MKTLTNLGTFGMVILPIALIIASLGAYFVAQVIMNNLTIY